MSKNYVELRHIPTGVILKVPDLSGMFGKGSVDYPSKWFEANKTKPHATISLEKNLSLETARANAYAFLEGSSAAGVLHVLEYLYLLFSNIKETLNTEWKSYNIVIGTTGVVVTPLSIITIKTTERDIMASSKLLDAKRKILDDKFDLYLVIMLMGLHRYVRTHEKSRQHIAVKVKQLAATLVPSTEYITDLAAYHSNGYLLNKHKQFELIASALDMFLERFPANRYAKARIGTIHLRYDGCTGFTDFEYLRNLVGLKDSSEFFAWFFTHSLGDEIRQMFKTTKEEIDDLHSYFPYMLGMGLSYRSAYSVARNPCMHLVAHIVGSLLNSNRSLNAQMVKNDCGFKCETMNALIIYIAHQSDIDDDDAKQKMHDADKWFKLFEKQTYKLDTKQYEQVRRAIQNIRNPRKGTIGEWVKNSMMSTVQVLTSTQ